MAILHILGGATSVAGFTLCAATGDWAAAGWALTTGCWVITSWLNRLEARR